MTKSEIAVKTSLSRIVCALCALLYATSISALAQTAAGTSPGSVVAPANTGLKAASTDVRDEYRLGPDDQIVINVMFAEELTNKTVRIDSTGYINIPFAGRVRAATLSVRELERDLTFKLKPFFENPNVVVNVAEYGSKPVSVLGEVHNPAVLQLRGPRTLVEMLSASGGLTNEAGSKLIITRQALWGPLPLAHTHMDPSGNFSTAEVDLGGLLSGSPTENILVCPDDTITVPRAKLIYVMGEVHKPGGFPLHDMETASVLQVVALAEGTTDTASIDHARILRPNRGLEREEIAVNLRKIIDRSQPDIQLRPDDILYVPNSKSKKAAIRGLETAIQMGTGIVIWGVRP
jgi:polysaccharide biosynthesis/export protein